jgi:drug/metabolite transporter (DMT)-like permease
MAQLYGASFKRRKNMSQGRTSPDYLAYVLLLSIGIVWGGQFLFNAQAVGHFPPITIAAARALIGALTLSLIACFRKETPVAGTGLGSGAKNLWLLLGIAVFEAVLPLFLIVWGQQHVASSIAAVIVGSTPIVTLIVALLLKSQKSHFSLGAASSVVLGFIGLVILMNPSAEAAGWNVLAYEIAILGGVVGFALGMTLFEKLPQGTPIRTIRNMLFLASVPLIIASLWFDKPWTLDWNPAGLASVLLLGVVCSGVAYLLYGLLIQRSGPVFTSISNFIVPLVGVLLGVFVRHEQFGQRGLIALAFIVAALIVHELKIFAKK